MPSKLLYILPYCHQLLLNYDWNRHRRLYRKSRKRKGFTGVRKQQNIEVNTSDSVGVVGEELPLEGMPA